MGEFRKRTQNTRVFTGMSYWGFCNALYLCLPLLATTLFPVQKPRAILQIVVVFEIGLRYGGALEQSVLKHSSVMPGLLLIFAAGRSVKLALDAYHAEVSCAAVRDF